MAPAPRAPQPPLGQRRAVILSGMYTSEVLEVIAAYKDAGLPPTVFAAAVPNNYGREVGDVVESCWKDQMVAQQRVRGRGGSRRRRAGKAWGRCVAVPQPLPARTPAGGARSAATQ
jgi:hypothetical protein